MKSVMLLSNIDKCSLVEVIFHKIIKSKHNKQHVECEMIDGLERMLSLFMCALKKRGKCYKNIYIHLQLKYLWHFINTTRVSSKKKLPHTPTLLVNRNEIYENLLMEKPFGKAVRYLSQIIYQCLHKFSLFIKGVA